MDYIIEKRYVFIFIVILVIIIITTNIRQTNNVTKHMGEINKSYNNLVEEIVSITKQQNEIKARFELVKEDALNGCGVNLTGKNGYFNGIYMVVSTDGRDVKDVIRTEMHETGHFFQQDYTNLTQKFQWENLHNTSEHFVSEYAKTNAKEDFAETFKEVMDVCYDVNRTEILSKEKREYFEKNVKPHFREC